MYDVFVRNWWRIENGQRVPHMGRKKYLARRVATEVEAQAIARQYNATHEPGRLSRKAEYEHR